MLLFIYDFETPFRQAFLDLALEHGDKDHYFRGAYQSWVEWRSPSDVCGPDAFTQALDRVHSDEVIQSRTPYDHAVGVLQALEAEGNKLIYISNRSPDCYRATKEWLYDCGFPKGDLVCVMGDKEPYISECQYIIDDRPKTLVQFVYSFAWRRAVNAGLRDERKGFGLLFEHNRALTDVPGIFLAPTWAGIGYYLSKEGVLDESSVRNLSLS